MFQVIDPGKLKDINPDLLIVQADSQELLDNKAKNTPVWTSLKAVQKKRLSMPITQPTCWALGLSPKKLL